jgi:hypothetical protein
MDSITQNNHANEPLKKCLALNEKKRRGIMGREVD